MVPGLSGVITLSIYGRGRQFGLSHVFVFNGTPNNHPPMAEPGPTLLAWPVCRAGFGRLELVALGLG